MMMDDDGAMPAVFTEPFLGIGSSLLLALRTGFFVFFFDLWPVLVFFLVFLFLVFALLRLVNLWQSAI